jgi:hypothetical protein
LGGFYGIIYSIVLAFKHWKRFVKEFRSLTSNIQVKIIRTSSFMLLLASIVLFFAISSISLKILLLTVAVIFFITLHAWLFMKSVEKVSMYNEKSVEDLVEGDWIPKDILVKGKKLVGPKDLGISKKQIALLKKYRIKKVLVKEGIPFVPSFLLGYIATLVAGNWLNIILR